MVENVENELNKEGAAYDHEKNEQYQNDTCTCIAKSCSYMRHENYLLFFDLCLLALLSYVV
jgi:hypothetical protein